MGQGYKKKNTLIFCRLFSYFLLIEICMHQDYNNDDNGQKKHQIKVQTITQRENTNLVMVQMSVPRDLLFLY